MIGFTPQFSTLFKVFYPLQDAGDPDQARLIRLANSGDAAARVDLAFHYESVGEVDLATYWMDEAAATGDAVAKMQRATWKLYGENYQRDQEAGFLEIKEVAETGAVENAQSYLAVLLANGIGCDRDWREAVECIARDAMSNRAHGLIQLALLQPGDIESNPLIQKLLNVARRQAGDTNARHTQATLRESAAAADIEVATENAAESDVTAWSCSEKRVFSEAPLVEIYPGVAPYLWRHHVISRARPLLHRAHVKDANSGRRIRDPMRTNTVALIELWLSDLIYYALSARIASATGEPISHQEPPNILNYRPGQTYEAHFDFINPDVPSFRNELLEQGQRTKTPLIYLNDNYEGGATTFPKAGRAYKADAGDLLVLHNTGADGEPDRKSLHIGSPPTSGEKWVFSTRIRTRPQIARIWPDI